MHLSYPNMPSKVPVLPVVIDSSCDAVKRTRADIEPANGMERNKKKIKRSVLLPVSDTVPWSHQVRSGQDITLLVGCGNGSLFNGGLSWDLGRLDCSNRCLILDKLSNGGLLLSRGFRCSSSLNLGRSLGGLGNLGNGSGDDILLILLLLLLLLALEESEREALAQLCRKGGRDLLNGYWCDGELGSGLLLCSRNSRSLGLGDCDNSRSLLNSRGRGLCNLGDSEGSSNISLSLGGGGERSND